MSPHAPSAPLPDEPSAGLTIAPGVTIPPEALEFTFSRSGGPGGQNVNKLATRAQLRLPLSALLTVLDSGALARLRHLAGARLTTAGDLLFTSSDSRSQSDNRRQCLDKLRQLILLARRVPKVRRPTRPSRGAKQRRLAGKKIRAEHKTLRRRLDNNSWNRRPPAGLL